MPQMLGPHGPEALDLAPAGPADMARWLMLCNHNGYREAIGAAQEVALWRVLDGRRTVGRGRRAEKHGFSYV